MRAPYIDTRGLLSFLILWILNNNTSMNGEEVAQELARRRGSKPAPGTIYPALKDLSRKGLIEGRVGKGRKCRAVFYTLTDRGRIGLRDTCDYFIKTFGDISKPMTRLK